MLILGFYQFNADIYVWKTYICTQNLEISAFKIEISVFQIDTFVFETETSVFILRDICNWNTDISILNVDISISYEKEISLIQIWNRDICIYIESRYFHL